MRSVILGIFLLIYSGLEAQSVYYPVCSDKFDLALRNSILGFRTNYRDWSSNQEVEPLFKRTDSVEFLLETSESMQQHAQLKKPLFKCFYQDGVNFLRYQKNDEWVVLVNPVLNVQYGQAYDQSIWTNERGLEIKGNIGGTKRGVGFYSYLSDNQQLFPEPYQFFTDSLNFVPNELFYKKFKNSAAVDFFRARAYITFNAVNNHIKFQFGHDKHRIGNGYRSLILSDFAPQYLFFKINTDVGRLHYQNLFTQFTDNGPIMSNVLYGKKYGAFHRLSYNLLSNLSIGFNEMVLFDRIDSTQMNQFDFNYLNPVIFYRAVESNLGSRDNSLMAVDFEYRLRHKYQFYGQLVLDEFNLKFIKNEPGWWANKYAYQLGAQAFNFIHLKGLDLQVEYNRCRPYTYSHQRPTQSYSHFNQSLAHPLGANFDEKLARVTYRKKRLTIEAILILARTGSDSFLMGRNYGSNILRGYETRATEFNSTLLMGKRQALTIAGLNIAYELIPSLYLELNSTYRKIGDSDGLMISAGIRMKANRRKLDY